MIKSNFVSCSNENLRKGGRRKVRVNDKNRQNEKDGLSQEWKKKPNQEGVEKK